MGKQKPADAKAKVPGWMVSFGDMMTLILTFFILLVSMSREQQVGLVAAGVGSFLVHAHSFGMNGVLDGAEKQEIFNEVRTRFNLPPLADPEEPEDKRDIAVDELITADDIDDLKPHDELFQPAVALFAAGTHELDENARQYLDALAVSLRPGNGQILVLEGQARPSEDPDPLVRATLAVRRARAVADYLVERHDFARGRLEARGWLGSLDPGAAGEPSVDARLILGP
ncbi:MAG: flagellar motor protein MotB [Planctomycetota bacterium]|jgi:chemotaxis protein MotB